MTAREFGVLADAIKTYFPRDNVLPTEHALKLWYMELKDIPYEMAYTALRRYASTSSFAPTIADIRMGVAEIRGGEGMNESEAWDIVMRAVKRSAWHSEKQFRDYWTHYVRKNLKFPASYKFYSLKDTGVTTMLRSRIDNISVRDQARHSSILITDIYTPHDIEKANPIIKNFDTVF